MPRQTRQPDRAIGVHSSKGEQLARECYGGELCTELHCEMRTEKWNLSTTTFYPSSASCSIHTLRSCFQAEKLQKSFVSELYHHLNGQKKELQKCCFRSLPSLGEAEKVKCEAKHVKKNMRIFENNNNDVYCI